MIARLFAHDKNFIFGRVAVGKAFERDLHGQGMEKSC